MLPVIPTLDIAKLSDSTAAVVAGVPTLGTGSSSGPLLNLGSCYDFPGNGRAQTIAWLSAAGALLGDFQYRSTDATDIELQVPANHGSLVVRYVKNVSGGTLSRGELVVSDTPATNGPFAVKQAGAVSPAAIVGAVMWDIPNLKAGFIAVSGPAYLKVSAAIAAGAAVKAAASGRIVTVGAATDHSLGFMVDDASGASAGDLHLCILRLQ